MREHGRHKRSRLSRARPTLSVMKSPREIELMRAAGRVVRQVLEAMRAVVRPETRLSDLGVMAEELIVNAGAEPLFKGVTSPATRFAFPAAICASVNDVVVHGIPDDRVLVEGDILSVDCGVRLKGYCGDAATTLPVGRISPEAQRLLKVTQETLELALSEMRPGCLWSEVAAMMQTHVESAGFSVVREFVGHGIGQEMHEEPKVPNYTDRQQRKHDFRLEPGLVVAVEPMVNLGGREVKVGDSSGWPQVTRDGSLSAHFEHTVAMTSEGVDILTS